MNKCTSQDPRGEHPDGGGDWQNKLNDEEQKWANYFKALMLCDSPLSFFKLRKLVTHNYKKLFPSNYIGPVTLANKKELEGTVKEIRFPVVQMLKDALFKYEEDFNKIVPDNITIAVNTYQEILASIPSQ